MTSLDFLRMQIAAIVPVSVNSIGIAKSKFMLPILAAIVGVWIGSGSFCLGLIAGLFVAQLEGIYEVLTEIKNQLTKEKDK